VGIKRTRVPFGLLCTIPALVVLASVILVPLARTILMSFQNYVLVEPAHIGSWAGLQNYIAVGQDKEFWNSVLRSLEFASCVLLGQLFLGMTIALVLNGSIRLVAIWRTLFMLPWILPQAQIVLLSIWMFNTQYGIINWFVEMLGGQRQIWFNSSVSMIALVVINIYRGFPFMMLMLIAGLQSIPLDVIEAARVDGANELQTFRYVTIPHLRPVLLVLVLTGYIWYMPHFMTIWTLTGGGPANRTFTLALSTYQKAFLDYDFGVASAQGVTWLILTIVVCILVIGLWGRRDR